MYSERMEKNRRFFIVSAVLLFLFSFLIRQFALSDYLFFGFEQGRDAYVAQDIYTLKHFPFSGPKTDLDGVFHGSFYYYLIAVPYFLFHGNPLAVATMLVIIGSFVPIVLFFFIWNITKSRKWSIVAGILGAISYELIIFSRWLSNVSPAMLFSTLSFFFLWLYAEKKSIWLFVGSTLMAALAMQCEIILLPLYIFTFILLLVLRIIPAPKRKVLLAGIVAATLVFLPLILFTAKNREITIRSVSTYFSDGEGGKSVVNMKNSIRSYAKQNGILVRRSVIYTQDNRVLFPAIAIISIGIFLYMRSGKKEKNVAVFLLLWLFMSAPLVLLSDLAGLSQAYVGIAPSLVLLTTLSLYQLSKQKRTKILAGLLILCILISANKVVYSLTTNSDVFYKTIQDDMNYADQKSVLTWIHNDSAQIPYRMDAYTIPYFQSHGWQYLHAYYFPQDTSRDARVIYVIIEEKVDPFWRDMWISDLGETTLLTELRVGRLRVQKRQLPTSQ